MALTSNFDALLKQYAPHDLIERETKKLSWVLQKLKSDKTWVPGSPYTIGFETAMGGSFRWGSYAAQADIQQFKASTAVISAPKALVGSMIFDQADLERHVSLEKSFLSALPRKLEGFTKRMAEQINLALLSDGSIASLTANGDAAGLVTIPAAATAFLENNMKIEIKDGDTAAVSGYIRNLNTNTGTFNLYDAPYTGGAAVSTLAYTTAQSAKIYLVGGSGERPTSLVDLCFSAADGGADSLYGGQIVKASAPVYQPFQADIATSNTGATLLASLYDVMFDMVESGRDGLSQEVIVPFNAFKAIAKATEASRKYELKDEETVYGSKKITITGPDADIKIRTARGVPKGKAMVINWDSMDVASYGELIQKGKKMGPEHFEIRNTTGYQFIVDKKAEFELVCHAPASNGGIKIATAIT